MPRLAFVVASLLAFAGCEKLNPLYCPDEPNSSGPGCIADPDAQSEPDVPRGLCQVSNDCTGTPNTPVCETTQSPHMCVQCTDEEHALCTGTVPLCRNNSCATCMLDTDCGTGGLCLPNGACAAATNIIHAVSMMGQDVLGCGVPDGPGACTLERALTEVTATKNVIKLDDEGPYTPAMSTMNMNNFVVDVDVTIDARGPDPGGAVLHRARDDRSILRINSNKIVTMFGGTIEGAINSDGIFCSSDATLMVDGITIHTIDKSAINARSGCKLTVTHAKISYTSQGGQFVPGILAAGNSVTLSRSSLFANKGGGISVTNGTFVIVGNSFSANGAPGSPVGGVSINTTTSDPMNSIEFNTISSNATMSDKVPGIDCIVGTGPIAIARNNIIWGNNGKAGSQVGGTCKHAYSDIGMLNVGGANDGGNNLSVDPMFMVVIYDLRLQPNSPMIKAADPMAKLDGVAAKDFDGDARIKPADIGYDQLPRP